MLYTPSDNVLFPMELDSSDSKKSTPTTPAFSEVIESDRPFIEVLKCEESASSLRKMSKPCDH